MAPNGQKMNEHFLPVDPTLFNPALSGPCPSLQAEGRGWKALFLTIVQVPLFPCCKPLAGSPISK